MPYRSKLTPFEAEIADLRRTRPPTPYTEIVRVLKERHGLAVQVSTLFNFVKVRRKWDRLQSLPPQPPPSTVARSASTQPMSEIQRDRSTPRVGATPARPVEPSPRSGKVSLPHEKPGGRTLKSFTPSSEYNLERLTPEQMAEWLAELKREQGG
jgi:hypothetical protein